MRKIALSVTLLAFTFGFGGVHVSAESKPSAGQECFSPKSYKNVGKQFFICYRTGKTYQWAEVTLKDRARQPVPLPTSTTPLPVMPSPTSILSPAPSPSSPTDESAKQILPPANIPGTSFAWPTPTEDPGKYSGIKRNQSAVDLLGLSSLHQQGITGSGYAVAFIDSSILSSHPDFANVKVICVGAVPSPVKLETFITGEKQCPADVGQATHGQSVAGTIGGQYGVAPGAELISISTGGYIQSAGIQEGLNWVLQNFKKYNIVSVSVSVGEFPSDRNPANDELICGVLQPKGWLDVLKALSKVDVAVVFSAGNSATVDSVKEPNCLPGVITVAAENSNDLTQIANYSSISSNVDLLAPADFSSTGVNGDETVFGGTSQAAPFVAGLFALGKQERPDANVAQIFYYLKSTGAEINDWVVKGIPAVRPVEMLSALKNAKVLPFITFTEQIQIKTGK